MKSIVLTIIKREFQEIFRDKTCIILICISTFIFPILSIGLNIIVPNKSLHIRVAVESQSDVCTDIFTAIQSNPDTQYIDIIQSSNAYEQLKNNDIDCIISIKDHVISLIANPYSYSSISSTAKFAEVFENVYLSSINHNTITFRMTDEQQQAINMPTAMVTIFAPAVFVMVIFQGVSGFANDMFAGERERKTIELLIHSTKRPYILFGKLIALAIISLLNTGIALFSYSLSCRFPFSSPLSALLTLVCLSILSIAASLISLTVSMHCKKIRQAQFINELFTLLPTGMTVAVCFEMINRNHILVRIMPILNLVSSFSTVVNGNWNISELILSIVISIAFIILLILYDIRYINSEKLIL
ncbi:MAG: ABC transporter permease subunit [Clostridia bacterium]|nr:ABC transporter permease subunit [Clostridia bacterium]